MPHSSGGGSCGGGFHGGYALYSGSRSALRTRTLPKSQWFAGSRLYLKRNADGYYEYVYASMMPRKASIVPVIVLTLLYSVLLPLFGRTAYDKAPKSLTPVYDDSATVYDKADVINDDASLAIALAEYQDKTGVCPVIYTLYKEDYKDTLAAYTFNRYVSTFNDEQHFVIVYAVSKEDAALLKEGKITVPDFAWEAVQGDETDFVITKSIFKGFGTIVQDELKNGADPGIAFSKAFHYATEKSGTLYASNIINTIIAVVPIFVVTVLAVILLAYFARKYWKEKDVSYVEVPLDTGAQEMSGGYSGNVAVKVPPLPAAPDMKTLKASGIKSSIILAFSIPLLIAGIFMLALGLAMIVNPATDSGLGIFFVILGILWIIMGVFGISCFASTMSNIKKAKRIMRDSAPDNKAVKQNDDAKMIDKDDEYNRMKNRGFE